MVEEITFEKEQISEEPVEIPIDDSSVEFLDGVDEDVEYAESQKPVMIINGDDGPLITTANSGAAYASSRNPIMKIGGNDSSARGTVNSFVSDTNSKTATVIINANDSPARVTVS